MTEQSRQDGDEVARQDGEEVARRQSTDHHRLASQFKSMSIVIYRNPVRDFPNLVIEV
jgi:hypothetical protein